MKRGLIGGGLLAAVGAVIIAVTLIGAGTSPSGWISGHYARTPQAGVYRTGQTPTQVAGTLSRRFTPLDRAYDPAGVFLRYSSVMVAVLADGRGSRIQVLPVDRGYRRYHSYVGGRWGGPGGRASSFRGGGPGSGK